jgi:predicted HAD superfamily Cof-like phosphohydrolase
MSAMRETMDAVWEFMEKAGDVKPDRPSLPPHFVRDLRAKMLREEFEEYEEAEANDDMVEIADALADMVYIIAGTAIRYGIPLDAVFREVHGTNMAKLIDGKLRYRDDGKILKPEGWRPPDVASVLENAGWREAGAYRAAQEMADEDGGCA